MAPKKGTAQSSERAKLVYNDPVTGCGIYAPAVMTCESTDGDCITLSFKKGSRSYQVLVNKLTGEITPSRDFPREQGLEIAVQIGCSPVQQTTIR